MSIESLLGVGDGVLELRDQSLEAGLDGAEAKVG